MILYYFIIFAEVTIAITITMLDVQVRRGVWGYRPPEEIEIYRLGNKILSIMQEIFSVEKFLTGFI